MPRATLRLSAIKVDPKWTPRIEEQLNVAVRNAARAWMRAVVVQIPVWSGMARGSVAFADGTNGFLSEFLNVAVPIDPEPGRTRRGKNAEAGGEMGHYSFTDSRHVFQFYFRSDVPHWLFHEIYARPASVQQQIIAPWQALQYGEAAFGLSMHDSLGKLPRVKSALIRVQTQPGT